MPRLQCPVASVFVTVVETETKHIRGPLTWCDLSIFQLHFAFSVNEIFMFNFLASQIPGPIFCTPASLGNASVTGMSIGNLQKIPSIIFITYFVTSFWNMKAQAQSLFGDSNAHCLGQKFITWVKKNRIHYMGQPKWWIFITLGHMLTLPKKAKSKKAGLIAIDQEKGHLLL